MAVSVVDYWRLLHAEPMYRVAGAVEEAIGELAIEGKPVPIEVSRRLKRIVTMINKLDRFPSGDVTGLHDIAGVRAVLPTIADVREVAAILADRLILVRPRDYIAEPRDSGYRALHLVAREAGLRVEIQLRTALQDTWANLVEQLGTSEGVELKFGLGPAELHDRLRDIATVFADLDSGIPFDSTMTKEMEANFERANALLAAISNYQQGTDDDQQ